MRQVVHPSFDRDELRESLDSKLSDIQAQLAFMTRQPTGDKRIDDGVIEVLRRAVVDFEKVFQANETMQAIGLGVASLEEVARGMSNVRPLALGAMDHLPPDGRMAADRIYRFSLDVERDFQAWRQTEFSYAVAEETQRLAAEIDKTATEIKSAAGDTGAELLENAFVKYAKDERGSAQAFRVATITLLGTVALLGLVAAVIPAFLPRAEFEWQDVVYRLSVLTALAGLAAYLGRQSGHHRRAAAWAEAIAVQLQAFPLFIRPIQGQKVADEIYEAFGKRVMGSPPDFAGKSDDTLNPTMLALIDALAKQARATS